MENKSKLEVQYDILDSLLKQIEPVDFRQLVAEPKICERHYVIYTVEIIISLAEKNDWGLCRNQNEIYIYNGSYWTQLDKNLFQTFLLKSAQRMGVPIISSKYFQFGEKLFKQFMMQSYLQTPPLNSDVVLINLLNGTYEIHNGKGQLREFRKEDFLTYQLAFAYDTNATAPIFDKYLFRVLPDESCRKVLAEYIGLLFIKTGNPILKEEKALLLYGSGANGKSVFFEIVNGMLGFENVTNHSLQDLTNESGYHRAQLANKLVNYASEINGKLESSIFKQLVSGEPVSARLPYEKPFHLTQYARLIFNCNELPKEVEHTAAYFRRFLIIPFDVTIPPEEQDKSLHNKIIENELAGVFNWVLAGLGRLLEQKKFTDCDVAQKAVEDYRLQSDSLRQFIDDEGYESDVDNREKIVDLYADYKYYCQDNGFFRLTKPNFIKRLKSCGIMVQQINIGNVAYLRKMKTDEK